MRNFKKFLALLLATMMVLGGVVTVSAADEAEVTATVDYDAIYKASADDLFALDILKGTAMDDGIDFALENGVTRWQMALFIARIMTGETSDQYWNKVSDNTTPYDDVTNYFGAISYADENGIIKGKGWIPGVGDNCFDPNAGIKYQDALTMAVRALGEKQLAYPNGFITVAGELGLTEGLETLDNNTELNRGQMVQILKNMLYCEIDGSSYAQKNFGLQEKVYVLVATNTQYMPGTDRTVNPGYVQLAELKADGTYDFNSLYHFTEDELGIKGKSEMMMGFSFTISSFDGFRNIYSVEQNATKLVQDYGDESDAIKSARNINNIKLDNIVSIDGVKYTLVKSFSNLNNKPTYIGQNNELIVHDMTKGTSTYDTTFYWYNANGDILDGPNGNVVLYYVPYANIYWVPVEGGSYRIATDADFEKYAVKLGGYNIDQYVVTTTADDLTKWDFSQIALIDDNNDGVYDRAVYVPYQIGKYTTKNVKSFNVTTGKDDGSNTTTPYVNGAALRAVAQKEIGGAWTLTDDIRQADVTFVDLDGKAARPSSGDWVVYFYNQYSRVFTVVEKLAMTSGKVTSFYQGPLSYSAELGYYYGSSTVTVDGEKTFKLGYRPADIKADLTYGDLEKIATTGWDDVIMASYLNPAYKPFQYMVLAGRVIDVKNSSEYDGWMAFDYGFTTKYGPTMGDNNYKPYTDWDYEGDILGVDEDGNILVKAYVDNSGDPTVAKIGKINGYNYGLLVEDYAAMNFQYSGIGITKPTAFDTMKKVVICDYIFAQLTADYADLKDSRQLVYTVANVENGVYDIYTDVKLYWGANADPYRQPATISANGNITFYKGMSTTKMNDKWWTLNAESVVLVAGTDGLTTYTGIPADGATLKTKDNTVYALSNDFIFVASATKTADQIFVGAVKDTENAKTAYTYYVTVGDAENRKKDNNSYSVYNYDGTYTYYNMYNVNTGALETVSNVPGGLTGFTGILNGTKPVGAIYATKDAKSGQFQLVDANIATIAFGGTANYTAVYAKKDAINAKTARNTAIDFEHDTYETADSGVLYDNDVKFVYDVLTITLNEKAEITKVAFASNKDSTSGDYTKAKGYDLYFTYEAGKSFQGLAIKVDASKVIVPPTPEQEELQAAQAAAATAKVELDAIFAGYTTNTTDIDDRNCKAEYNYALGLLNKAKTRAEVDTVKGWFAGYKALVAAAKQADAEAEAAKPSITGAGNQIILKNVAASSIEIRKIVSSSSSTVLYTMSNWAVKDAAGKVVATYTGANNGYGRTYTAVNADPAFAGEAFDLFPAGGQYMIILNGGEKSEIIG